MWIGQRGNKERIPFTLAFHPHNHAVKSITLKNFKLLQNDPDKGRIFSQPPLISFKRDKNIGNFLVRSVFQTSEQPGTFKCAQARCKTCPFICNVEKISGPKRSIKITDHFTCTSANVTYCITCTLCKKLYIGETGRRLGDRFREHHRDVEKDDKDASKPIARPFNLPNHSMQHMSVAFPFIKETRKAAKLFVGAVFSRYQPPTLRGTHLSGLYGSTHPGNLPHLPDMKMFVLF